MVKVRPSTILVGALAGIASVPCASDRDVGMARCRTESGAVLFTQFACPAGTDALEPEPGDGVLSVVTSPELSTGERRALDALEARLAQRRQVDRRARVSQSRARERARHEAEAQCAEAIRELDAIGISRRRGYTAAEARRLDAAEARWRAVKRRSC